jgi:hypothetical protein
MISLQQHDTTWGAVCMWNKHANANHFNRSYTYCSMSFKAIFPGAKELSFHVVNSRPDPFRQHGPERYMLHYMIPKDLPHINYVMQWLYPWRYCINLMTPLYVFTQSGNTSQCPCALHFISYRVTLQTRTQTEVVRNRVQWACQLEVILMTAWSCIMLIMNVRHKHFCRGSGDILSHGKAAEGYMHYIHRQVALPKFLSVQRYGSF